MTKKKPAAKKRAKRISPPASTGRAGRRRGRKPYPTLAFEETLKLAQGIMKHAAGHPVRRLTLLQQMKMDAGSRTTRDLISNSVKYGLTQGHHSADELKLTEKGRIIVSSTSRQRERQQVIFELAIEGIDEFSRLYQKFKGHPMPSLEVMQDELEELDLVDRRQCVDLFVGNSKFVGLLRTIDGAQHILSIEDALDELAREKPTTDGIAVNGKAQVSEEPADTTGVDFERVCFFIAPIGDDKSEKEGEKEQRKHSDMIFTAFVRRALEEQNLEVVRADKISKPGMISGQIIESVLKSRLVVADLSFHNPNVFYELCLRHVIGKPTVHIIRKGDKIPFDIGNFRTIEIAMDDKYQLVAELDSYRAEIANQVRQVLVAGHSRDNPILTFCPSARFVMNED